MEGCVAIAQEAIDLRWQSIVGAAKIDEDSVYDDGMDCD